MSDIHFHTGEGDDVHGEYHSYDGVIEVYLGGHMTLYGLFDTIIHEQLHEAIEENSPDPTTEKQDHWVIQRLCF
jgi:hypothetical protein